MRHTSTVVSVPSQADTQISSIGVTWSTNALGACSLRFGIAGQPLSHGPIVLRSPVRERSAHGGRVLWATGCDAHAGTRRVPTVASTSSHAFSSQIWPFRLQIWTKGVLVEHRAPVVGRCNVCPVSFKNRLDTTHFKGFHPFI